MDDLIKLVRTYRFTSSLAEKQDLAEKIIRLVAPKIYVRIHAALATASADDVFQETLKAIATSLKSFRGDTPKEFWAWCYGVASHKLNDHFRKQGASRLLPMDSDELLLVIERNAHDNPISQQNRHDLDYAMRLLKAAHPDCARLLWDFYVVGLDYADLAARAEIQYDAARMQVNRCLEKAQTLVA